MDGADLEIYLAVLSGITALLLGLAALCRAFPPASQELMRWVELLEKRRKRD
ncbi:hypothetical protein ACETIH_06640 [Microvirga arabica]|uniref:Uncharacterized protein n=1 Tax=Microvirga arabica TaxID=1128671 RepID=A0ABV6Y550_9HYPH